MLSAAGLNIGVTGRLRVASLFVAAFILVFND
jgi:hypothetical protein